MSIRMGLTRSLTSGVSTQIPSQSWAECCRPIISKQEDQVQGHPQLQKVTRLNPGYIRQTLFQIRTKIKLQIKGDWLEVQALWLVRYLVFQDSVSTRTHAHTDTCTHARTHTHTQRRIRRHKISVQKESCEGGEVTEHRV